MPLVEPVSTGPHVTGLLNAMRILTGWKVNRYLIGSWKPIIPIGLAGSLEYKIQNVVAKNRQMPVSKSRCNEQKWNFGRHFYCWGYNEVDEEDPNILLAFRSPTRAAPAVTDCSVWPVPNQITVRSNSGQHTNFHALSECGADWFYIEMELAGQHFNREAEL